MPALRSATCSAGLAIGWDSVRFVEVASTGDRYELKSAAVRNLPFTMADCASNPSAADHLAQTIAAITGDLRKRYVPFHVSLADPLVRTSIFELDELPAGDAAQLALVQFRMTRESALDDSCFAMQALGPSGLGKHLLLGMATSRAIYDKVVVALRSANVTAWSMAGNSVRLLNVYATEIAGSSGALVAVESDSWSVSIFDDRGRIRYVRSQWRLDLTPAEIATEVQRAILAYVHSGGDRSVAAISVTENAATEHIAAELEARMDRPCRRLAMTVRLAGLNAEKLPIEYGSPLAAALQ
jgi:hypothetical protein